MYNLCMDTSYTVSLWSSKMPFPLHFAEHVWFVISSGDTTDRFEVWAPLWVKGYNTVICNAMEPTGGFRRSYFDHPTHPKNAWKAVCLGTVSGPVDSSAHDLYKLIKHSENTYPYPDKYRLWPGPNSNTYVGWVLNHFRALPLPIPWNAFGKNYNR